MVKIKIVATGSEKDKNLVAVISEFEKRLSRWAKINIVYVQEFAPANANMIETSKERESVAQLKHFEGFNIVLDSQGIMLSSEEFADKMATIMQNNSTITFIIGGSCGLSDKVKKQADLLMSFGKITFPHELMRLVLIEQIYRAFTINNNLPYHK